MGTLPFINVTDRTSLQAITEGALRMPRTFRMLIAGAIPTKQAAMILRVLSLAQRNL